MRITDKNAVVEAIKAGRVKSISVDARGDRRLEEIAELAAACGVPVHKTVGKESSRKRGGGQKHSPVEAWCDPFEYVPFEHLRGIVEEAGDSTLVLALDHIQDPRNLGAVLRSAAAAGAHGVLIETRRCCDVTEVAYETSCGGADKTAVVKVVNLRQSLVEMKKWGCWIAGADERAGQDCYSADFTRPLVIALGSEGDGLSRIVREECDFLIRIPTAPEFPSLNISVAAAVLTFEARRQKTSGAKK